MKVGLIGEAPHDINCVKGLLMQKYPELTYINLLNNIRGSDLDNKKVKSALRKEFESHKPDLVLFVRDLDALRNNIDKYEERMNYLREFRSVVNRKAILLLFIWEIEAMIFFDSRSFESTYLCKCESLIAPHEIESPKEVLKKLSKNKYREIHNSKLFAGIDINILIENSSDFSQFIVKFESALS